MITLKKENLKKLNNENTWANVNKKILESLNEIELAKTEVIHFIGIGGIGMSGLSLIMKGKGFKVQGSDLIFNKNIERLKKEKLKFF